MELAACMLSHNDTIISCLLSDLLARGKNNPPLYLSTERYANKYQTDTKCDLEINSILHVSLYTPLFIVACRPLHSRNAPPTTECT